MGLRHVRTELDSSRCGYNESHCPSAACHWGCTSARLQAKHGCASRSARLEAKYSCASPDGAHIQAECRRRGGAACTMAQILQVGAAADPGPVVVALMSSSPACGACIMACNAAADKSGCAMACAVRVAPIGSLGARFGLTESGLFCCRVAARHQTHLFRLPSRVPLPPQPSRVSLPLPSRVPLPLERRPRLPHAPWHRSCRWEAQRTRSPR
jgi:hypothetical protein